MFRVLLICVVLCAVLVLTECERGYCKSCRFIPSKRIKRGKYPGPPKRFYSRPPVRFPYLGAVSYTPPPPSYMTEDDQPYPGPPAPYKVSKRPPNEGLRDEDINNLMKHLTQQDLDKIIELAYDKQRERGPYQNSLEKFTSQYSKYPPKSEEVDFYKASNDDFTAFENFEKEASYPQRDAPKYTSDNINPNEKEPKFSFNGPYVNQKPYNNYANEEPTDFVLQQSNTIKEFKIPDSNNNVFQNQQEYVNLNKNVEQSNVVFENSNVAKPSNIRQDDYFAAYTNNVPKVVTPEDSTYKVEDFGDLPLMNYNSKLDTVSSYQVPHYTITKPSTSQGSGSIKTPPIEPAPPVSAAKEQSDAHLKAVKIWSHRSKGTSYYLHSDGRLTLERPTKPNYGSY